jgi:hypothetical protein
MKLSNTTYTTDAPTAEKVFRISLNKAIISVLGIIAISALGSVWATISLFNSVPFRVDAVENQIVEMRKSFMPLDLSMEKWKNNDKQHEEIIRRLDVIQTTLGRLK